jgi:hypothetical protein
MFAAPVRIRPYRRRLSSPRFSEDDEVIGDGCDAFPADEDYGEPGTDADELNLCEACARAYVEMPEA